MSCDRCFFWKTGDGYTDIQIVVPARNTGCIIDVKYAENGIFDAACREVLRQIAEREYVAALSQEGMEVIYQYGIAYYKKAAGVCA